MTDVLHGPSPNHCSLCGKSYADVEAHLPGQWGHVLYAGHSCCVRCNADGACSEIIARVKRLSLQSRPSPIPTGGPFKVKVGDWVVCENESNGGPCVIGASGMECVYCGNRPAGRPEAKEPDPYLPTMAREALNALQAEKDAAYRKRVGEVLRSMGDDGIDRPCKSKYPKLAQSVSACGFGWRVR